MSQSEIIELIIVVALILVVAYFSAAETALFSLGRLRARHLVEAGHPEANAILQLFKKPNILIATILVSSTMAITAASSLATVVALKIFPHSGEVIATVVMIVVVLVFGEITPKTFAAQNTEKVSLRVARTIVILSIILSPLIKILSVITNFLVRLLGGKTLRKGPFVTEEEIRLLVNVGQEEGLIEEEEKEMIDSIFEFDDTLAHEIMVPRIDITAIEVDDTLNEVLELILQVGHSRIPVYENTIDNVIGIIYAKDLLKFLYENRRGAGLREIMRLAYYVPETKKVRDLLAELKREKIHMAIVLDEHGGTAGLVTIEDMIEEIVGDIQDEFDREEKEYEWLEDGSLLVDARLSLDEINDLMEINLPEEDFDSLSGFIFDLLGRVPREGEETRYENLNLKIVRMEGRRISKVGLRKLI